MLLAKPQMSYGLCVCASINKHNRSKQCANNKRQIVKFFISVCRICNATMPPTLHSSLKSLYQSISTTVLIRQCPYFDCPLSFFIKPYHSCSILNCSFSTSYHSQMLFSISRKVYAVPSRKCIQNVAEV